MQQVHFCGKEQYLIDYGVPYRPSTLPTGKIVTADAVIYTTTMSALIGAMHREKAELLLRRCSNLS
jgi:hypothetical protein